MKYARLFPNASSSTRLISNDHGFCQYPNIPIMRNFHTQSTTTNLPAGSDHKNVLQVIATHCASTVAPSFLVSDEAAAGFASFCYGAISDGKSGTGMGGLRKHLLELWDIELWLRHHGWGRASAVGEGDWLWRRRQVLVGVEAADGCDICDVCYLDHRVLLAERIHVLVRRVRWEIIATLIFNGMTSVRAKVVVLEPIIVSRFLEFLRHRWESDALWEIWQWVDQASLLVGIVEEGATFTKLALTSFLPVLTWNCLIIRMNCAQSSFTEILW